MGHLFLADSGDRAGPREGRAGSAPRRSSRSSTLSRVQSGDRFGGEARDPSAEDLLSRHRGARHAGRGPRGQGPRDRPQHDDVGRGRARMRTAGRELDGLPLRPHDHGSADPAGAVESDRPGVQQDERGGRAVPHEPCHRRDPEVSLRPDRHGFHARSLRATLSGHAAMGLDRTRRRLCGRDGSRTGRNAPSRAFVTTRARRSTGPPSTERSARFWIWESSTTWRKCGSTAAISGWPGARPGAWSCPGDRSRPGTTPSG